MNLLNRYSYAFLTISLTLTVNTFYAQQDSLIINQAPELEKLLALK
ncbi:MULTISPECIES: hypothetical protein [Bizionia]|nr:MULTISPECIES: hypothetical protein [Bizionia]